MKHFQKIIVITALLTFFMVFYIVPIALAECPGETHTIDIAPGQVFDTIEVYFEECDSDLSFCGPTGVFKASWRVINGPPVDVLFGNYTVVDDWYYDDYPKIDADFSNSLTSNGCINWTTVQYIEHYLVISNYHGGSTATVEYEYSHSRDMFIPGFEFLYLLSIIAFIIVLAFYSKKVEARIKS